MRSTSRRQKQGLTWPALLGLALTGVPLLIPVSAFGQGGPPMVIDDPDTPGPGFWEINLSSVLERSRPDRRLEAPFADINYGVGTSIQLKFEIPWLSVHQDGAPTQTGAGNSLIGVKWRFLGEEGHKLAWSIYPQLEINTGRAMIADGFLDDGVQFLLPTDLTVRMGSIEINGELGRTFASRGPSGLIFGVSLELEMRGGFELLGEVVGERNDGAQAELGFDVGGRQRITKQITLLGAVGTAFRGDAEERTRLRVYAGLQFNLPHKFEFNSK
jgi:hypothetical protein